MCFAILEYKFKQGYLLFALRHINVPEHGLPGCAHNRPCPLSFEYVSSVWSSRCRLRRGCSQRYLGPRPTLRTPAMAVSRGPGLRVWVARSVIKRRGKEAVSRDWLSPVLVGAFGRVRSSSGRLDMLEVLVEFESSAGQVRVKCPGYVRVKFA